MATEPRQVAAAVVAALRERGLTVAVAESLTGGMLVSALVDVPGASAVLRGGVVAYDTRIKASLLGVDPGLLDRRGAVDAEVACQMADGVRRALAVDGAPADVGVATTGVAGPDPQDGHPVGTAFVGFAFGERVFARRLALRGSREAIRSAVVSEALAGLDELVAEARE